MANEQINPQDAADIEEAKAAYQAYLAHAQEAQAPAPSAHPIKDAAMTGLHALGAGMDWAGGNVRNAVAQGLDAKSLLKQKLSQALGIDSQEPVALTKEGDTLRALKGNAPRSDEYLERAGLGKGGQLSDVVPGYAEPGKGGMFRPEKGGALDPSVRGVAGFVGDTALDPLTYLSGGLSAVAKKGGSEGTQAALKALLLANAEGGLTKAGKAANLALNPMETIARPLASKAYQGAFGKVDSAVGKFQNSGETVAQLAEKHGFVGNPQQAADFVRGLNDKAGEEIGRILDEASSKGGKLDLNQSLAKAQQRANELRSTGHIENQGVADMIEKRISALKEAHGSKSVSPELSASAQRFEEPNASVAMEDPYNSVMQDRNRVLHTTTTRPQLLKDGKPISDEALAQTGGSLYGANPNVKLGEEVTRQRSFLPLEVEPKTGQQAFPFPESSTQAAPKVVPRERVSYEMPVNEANKLKSMQNADANFHLTSEDTMKGKSIKAITQPMADDITDAVGSVDQKLKEALLKNNSRYHSTNDDVQYLLDSWAGKAPQLRNPVTPTKVDLLALGVSPGSSLLKKAGDIALSTRGRTTTGFALNKLGQKSNSLADTAARQLIWEQALKQQGENK